MEAVRGWVWIFSGIAQYPRIRFKFFLANMDAAEDKTMKSSSSSPKKLFSKSSAKTSNMTGSSAAVSLVDTYPDPGPLASEISHQMIRFSPLRFLSVKKCSSICPEKTTKNSIQMVSAPGDKVYT